MERSENKARDTVWILVLEESQNLTLVKEGPCLILSSGYRRYSPKVKTKEDHPPYVHVISQ